MYNKHVHRDQQVCKYSSVRHKEERGSVLLCHLPARVSHSSPYIATRAPTVHPLYAAAALPGMYHYVQKCKDRLYTKNLYERLL